MNYEQWHKEFVAEPARERYNIFRDGVHAQIASDYPLTLNIGHQNKHIEGTAQFDPQRSTLTADPAELIKLYAGKSSSIQTRGGEWNQRERFTHTAEIGIWRDINTGAEAPTPNGIIHYTKRRGAHIVPANPRQG